ncbi:MAG: acetoacetate--CoA ligase [Marine Group III euryarchaeote CG-Epi3]|jgi:acetoacetyl-CoA synthetase|uniref:Acetoacetate--CoA ligase n=1 Tax=Marine Group III euryarchaeote CG-Epi3 TaxID=1888997 RepID=A0A1J5TPA5_9ARCH|nr:MAG: acetoacetate--CoA ligase [Marine Group III euryarchaeote CG-Epi3]
MSSPLWLPSNEKINNSLMHKFMQNVSGKFSSYFELHQWSINDMESFWAEFWKFSNIKYSRSYDSILDNPVMPGAQWFLGSELNYAENLLKGDSNQVAIISLGENKLAESLTFKELNQKVSSVQKGLIELGVKKGTIVAGFVPNCVETVIIMLAVSSLGGIWTSCSPDFGAKGVVDRFGQVSPHILVTSNGYSYNGNLFKLEDKVNGVLDVINSIEHIVEINYVDVHSSFNHKSVISFDTLLENEESFLKFEQLPFDHPLYIMYSSGTTGPPKSIIHSAGGTLIQHMKEHQLHCDVQVGKSKMFWFTTCGWMMWNWLVSGLSSGATVVLYDGSPSYPNLENLWKMIDDLGITHFGTSPKFLSACDSNKIVPNEVGNFDSLNSILSTGSPLVEEQFDWVYDNVKSDIQLSSISGGTDIIGCFLAGSPILPVFRGELQCPQLGMSVESWNDDGVSVIGESGELVCTKPFPSMPIGFWNDSDGSKYNSAYFDQFEGIWTHGDYLEITENGGAIIYGRSDTTLNPGGVRIGTAEIYRSIENFEEVIDSVVIGKPEGPDVSVVLCLKLSEGTIITKELEDKIKLQIRKSTTPRHVPRYVFQVADIPYTISGKKVEKAVLHSILGKNVKNKDALSNPESLVEYTNLRF